MPTDRLILILVHIIAAVTLFAAPATVSSVMRRARAVGRDAYLAAIKGVRVQVLVANIGGLLALGSGIGLLFVSFGGFATAPKNYHAAMAVIVVILAIGLLVTRPAAKRLHDAVTAGEDATRLHRRVTISNMVNHTLWTVNLVLMYVYF